MNSKLKLKVEREELEGFVIKGTVIEKENKDRKRQHKNYGKKQ